MKNKDRFNSLEKCELYFYKEIVRNIDIAIEFEEWAELEIEDIKSLFEKENLNRFDIDLKKLDLDYFSEKIYNMVDLFDFDYAIEKMAECNHTWASHDDYNKRYSPTKDDITRVIIHCSITAILSMFDSDGNLRSPFKECSTGGFSVIAFTESFDITKKEISLRISYEKFSDYF